SAAEAISLTDLGSAASTCGLLEDNVRIRDVLIDHESDLLKSRLVVPGERVPEATGLLRPKQTRIQDAVAIAIFEGTECPTSAGCAEWKLVSVPGSIRTCCSGLLRKLSACQRAT